MTEQATKLKDGNDDGDDPAWDATEAEALYDLLERQVIPEFYGRDASGIPANWVARMRESMARLTPRFSTSRAVREYTEQHYLPAATAYRVRAAERGAIGARVAKWQHTLEQNWATLRFGEVTTKSGGTEHVFEVEVDLGSLDPSSVRVDLYAEGVNGGEPHRQEMRRIGPTADHSNGWVYKAVTPAARAATDYTPRSVRAGQEERPGDQGLGQSGD